MSERSSDNTATERGSGELQLRLLGGGSKRPDWQLDERTRLVGRQGVAQAREILRRAQPPVPKQPVPVRKAS
jgi:hypothetical protein